MRSIPLKKQSNGLSTEAVLLSVLRAADEGLSEDDLRKAAAGVAQLQAAADKPAALISDDAYDYLVAKLAVARWRVVDPFIVEVLDDVKASAVV